MSTVWRNQGENPDIYMKRLATIHMYILMILQEHYIFLSYFSKKPSWTRPIAILTSFLKYQLIMPISIRFLISNLPPSLCPNSAEFLMIIINLSFCHHTIFPSMYWECQLGFVDGPGPTYTSNYCGNLLVLFAWSAPFLTS